MPSCDHPLLRQYDELIELLSLALTKSCNIALTDDQWTLNSLAVWSGLGVRSVSMLNALSVFLDSAAGTHPLKSHILRNPRLPLKIQTHR